jgi:hypothetical protein
MASASRPLSRCHLEHGFFFEAASAAGAEIGMAAAPAAKLESPIVQEGRFEAILCHSRRGMQSMLPAQKCLRDWALGGYKLRSSVTHHVLL